MKRLPGGASIPPLRIADALAGYSSPAHHVAFGGALPRLISLPLPLGLSVSRVSDQTPCFLIASAITKPASFGPLAKEASSSCRSPSRSGCGAWRRKRQRKRIEAAE